MSVEAWPHLNLKVYIRMYYNAFIFYVVLQFSLLVVFDSLWYHALQHARPTPRPCSNSRPSSQWCHTTISPSVVPFSSCLQSFPASGSLMSHFFASGGQSIGISASVLPMDIQDWYPSGLTGWISLQSEELSRGFSNTIVQNHQFFGAQLSLWSNSHIWAPKSLQMVIAAMKLKDVYSLEGKLWPT